MSTTHHVSSNRTAGRAPDVLRLLRSGYESAVRAIIRPPQSKYSLDSLGPGPNKHFNLDNSTDKYIRTDAVVVNDRGLKLQCSHWEPVHRPRGADGAPISELDCVLYLHGNSSCRAAVMEILPMVLTMGATVFAFDSVGCGKSEGEWVTLGHWEKADLQLLLRLLGTRREPGNPLCGIKGRLTGRVALYGRSMGASTAIMAAGEDAGVGGGALRIAAVIADSPFSDLRALINDLLAANLRGLGCWRYLIPGCALYLFISHVRSTVKERTGMDFFALRPVDSAPRATQPILLAAGANDHFVHARNAEACLAQWGGSNKRFMLLPGCDHNTRRPAAWFAAVQAFLDRSLRLHPQPNAGGKGAAGSSSSSSSAVQQQQQQPRPALASPPSASNGFNNYPDSSAAGAAAISPMSAIYGSGAGAAAAAAAAAGATRTALGGTPGGAVRLPAATPLDAAAAAAAAYGTPSFPSPPLPSVQTRPEGGASSISVRMSGAGMPAAAAAAAAAPSAKQPPPPPSPTSIFARLASAISSPRSAAASTSAAASAPRATFSPASTAGAAGRAGAAAAGSTPTAKHNPEMDFASYEEDEPYFQVEALQASSSAVGGGGSSSSSSKGGVGGAGGSSSVGGARGGPSALHAVRSGGALGVPPQGSLARVKGGGGSGSVDGSIDDEEEDFMEREEIGQSGNAKGPAITLRKPM